MSKLVFISKIESCCCVSTNSQVSCSFIFHTGRRRNTSFEPERFRRSIYPRAIRSRNDSINVRRFAHRRRVAPGARVFLRRAVPCTTFKGRSLAESRYRAVETGSKVLFSAPRVPRASMPECRSAVNADKTCPVRDGYTGVQCTLGGNESERKRGEGGGGEEGEEKEIPYSRLLKMHWQ